MITLYMAGDSTMSIKSEQAYPETGWGVPFAQWFNDDVTVANYAVNGRSTRSFRNEGSWAKILDRLREEDVVIIQFGHNDEVPEKAGRYTTPEEFKENLTRFIREVEEKGAEPLLATPIARREFDEDGRARDTHPYAAYTREVAAETGVRMIDMDVITRKHVEALGPEESKALYLHLAPGEFDSYPKGRADNTHLSVAGASAVAGLFLAEVRRRGHRLARYVRAPAE